MLRLELKLEWLEMTWLNLYKVEPTKQWKRKTTVQIKSFVSAETIIQFKITNKICKEKRNQLYNFKMSNEYETQKQNKEFLN